MRKQVNINNLKNLNSVTNFLGNSNILSQMNNNNVYAMKEEKERWYMVVICHISGCETWTIGEAERKRLEAFEYRAIEKC